MQLSIWVGLIGVLCISTPLMSLDISVFATPCGPLITIVLRATRLFKNVSSDQMTLVLTETVILRLPPFVILLVVAGPTPQGLRY